MKEIFTELYKKVVGFFQTQESQDEQEGGSNKIARNRLKLVLMQDRTNLTPFLLERMRGEMIDVLSKYVEMDKDELELNFEQEGDSMALMLSFPVLRAKDEEEIQAILKAEEEAKAVERSQHGSKIVVYDRCGKKAKSGRKDKGDEGDQEAGNSVGFINRDIPFRGDWANKGLSWNGLH